MKIFLLALLVTTLSACASSSSKNTRVVANEQEVLKVSTDVARPLVIQTLSFTATASNCIAVEAKMMGFSCRVDLSSLGLDPDGKIVRSYAPGSHIKDGFVIKSNIVQSLGIPYKMFVEVTASGAGKPEVRIPTEKLNTVFENGIEIEIVYEGPEIKF